MGVIQTIRSIMMIPEGVDERASEGPFFSVSDPALAEYLGIAGLNNNLLVTESTALGQTAFYRGVSIIAGTIAGLPMKTYTTSGETKKKVNSFLDKPAGPYKLTSFAWKELVMVHLLVQGEVFLLHIYNNAGALIGLWPIHKDAVEVKWNGASKEFKIHMADNTYRTYNDTEMTHVMGMTLDGTRGLSPLTLFRQTYKLGMAGEIAATRSFTNGMLIAGLVTPDTDMEEEEAKEIKKGLQAKLTGVENAGDIAVVNRSLKFTPWSMSMEDAQFLQSREFQVIEFARMLGIPPHLLGATEKQTSWGTGVSEQNLGLQKFTLMPWTSRLEEALSELLPNPRFVEFEYAGLLQGSPKEEIELLIKQVEAGLITKDEARAIRNLPPLTEAQKAEQTPKGGDGADGDTDSSV